MALGFPLRQPETIGSEHRTGSASNSRNQTIARQCAATLNLDESSASAYRRLFHFLHGTLQRLRSVRKLFSRKDRPMTTKFFLPLLVASGLFLTSPDALAHNNAFSPQGRLNAGGVPANGNYDLRFALFAASAGGTQFVTAIDDSGAQTAGVRILAGETAWSAISDKNSKKNFQPLDSLATLEKLAAIPVQKWNYKWESETNTPHIGPVAQDFKEAFYPGRDDKTI